MKNLIKTTAAVGSTEILLMSIALLRNKYLAVTIGPEGFGVYGILNSFFMMIAVFAGTWMTTGTIKYISEYQAKENKYNLYNIYSFSTIIVAVIGLSLTIILLIWRKWVIRTFLSSEIKEIYYIIFCVAFSAICLRPVLLGVLQGLRRIPEVIISRWSIAIINLIFTVILVWFWGLTGFFLSLLVDAVFALWILFWGIRRKDGLQFRKFSCKDPIIRTLFNFGIVNLFLGLINLSSQYLQRTIVLHNMDIASVGLFQAGVALMGYIGVINRGSAFYFFPKMSEEMNNTYRNYKVNEYLRFILLFSIPLSVIAILFGKWAIIVLYSYAFTSLSSVFFLFVIGQLFKSISSVFQSTIIGMARLKMHSISTIVTHSLWVIIPFIFINQYGIGSLGFGFIAGGLFGSLLNWMYLRNSINFKFTHDVIILFIILIITISGALLLLDRTIFLRICFSIATIGLILKMIHREELIMIKKYISNKMRKSRK